MCKEVCGQRAPFYRQERPTAARWPLAPAVLRWGSPPAPPRRIISMYAISWYRRVWKVTLVAVLTLIATATPRAQAPVSHRQITYIMPIIHGPVTPVEAADL